MFNERQADQIGAVLDTSVVVAGYRSGRGASGEIVRLWREEHRFQLILSDPILMEWTRVLLKSGVPGDVIEDFMTALRVQALLTDDVYVVDRILDDPSDNVFLGTALAGGAQYVVSLDRHLLLVKYFHGIHVVRPQHFLGILRLKA